ncbi:MAG: dockerin type I repeat-containing protein [Phycisphaerales bacterium]|nr:dockerin type I repeat-containing protein [Phycisphaerales bacterium]
MADPRPHPDTDEHPRLADALRRRVTPDVRVPAALDDAMRRAAFARLGRRPWHARGPVRVGGALAACVAIGLTVWVLQMPVRQPAPATVATSMAPGDIDGDGRVNIRDAYVLYRRLEAREAIAADLNHDGVTNLADVAALCALVPGLDGPDAVRTLPPFVTEIGG